MLSNYWRIFSDGLRCLSGDPPAEFQVLSVIPESSSIVALLAVLMQVFANFDSTGGGAFTEVRLVEALSRGSQVELEEIGANLTGDDLSRLLASGDRRVVLASLVATRTAADGWQMLSALAGHARQPDRPIAELAAEIALALTRALARDALPGQDSATHDLSAHRAAWRAVLEQASLAIDIRVRAVEILTTLAHASGDPEPPFPLAVALADEDPELRRAALELWPPGHVAKLRAHAVRLLTEDAEPAVALAAAQALCSPGPDADMPAVLTAIGDPGLRRIAELTGDVTLPPAALLDACRCLVADGSEPNLQATRTLARDGPAVIQERLRALVDQP